MGLYYTTYIVKGSRTKSEEFWRAFDGESGQTVLYYSHMKRLAQIDTMLSAAEKKAGVVSRKEFERFLESNPLAREWVEDWGELQNIFFVEVEVCTLMHPPASSVIVVPVEA